MMSQKGPLSPVKIIWGLSMESFSVTSLTVHSDCSFNMWSHLIFRYFDQNSARIPLPSAFPGNVIGIFQKFMLELANDDRIPHGLAFKFLYYYLAHLSNNQFLNYDFLYSRWQVSRLVEAVRYWGRQPTRGHFELQGDQGTTFADLGQTQLWIVARCS